MNEYISVIMNAGQSWIRQGQLDQARFYYQEAENLLRLRLQADDTHFQSWGDMTWLLAEQASLNVILQKPVLALK